MANEANPVQVQKFLKGVDYPASREQLVATARREGADGRVVHGLESMPDRSYDGPTAVSQAFSDVLEEIDEELDDD